MPDRWVSIRKGAELVYLGVSGGTTLSADNFEYGTHPTFHLRFDVNRNLRTRARPKKADDMYADAKELADGGMKELQFVEIHHDRLATAILSGAKRLGQVRGPWTLTIRLERDWTSTVRPELMGKTLVLRVT